MIPEPLWTPTGRQYHADLDRWSSSMIKTFRDSPVVAWQRYVARSHEPPPPTGPMEIGSAVNTLLLRPEQAATPEGIVRVDVGSRNTKKWREAKEQFPQAVVMTDPEYQTARLVADAIQNPQTRAAEVGAALLSSGYAEYAHRWDDSAGVRCRLMIDTLTTVGGEPTIVELKSARDPEPVAFGRQAFNLGYHCQGAFYQRGIATALEGVLPNLIYVVVRNEPPFEVAVYQASVEYITLGERQIAEDLKRLAVLLEQPPEERWCQEWESVEGALPTLEPPPWEKKKLYSGFTRHIV